MEKIKMQRYKKWLLSVTFLLLTLLGMQALAGTVIVTNVLSNTVTLFDEATLKPINEVKVGYMPHEVVITQDEKTALVANFGDLINVIPGHSITSIDIAHAKKLQTIELPKKSRPHGLAIISESQALVTAQGIQALLVIDFVNGKILRTIALPGSGAHMVVVDAEKQFAYVANTDSGTVCKINLKSFSVVAEMKIGKEAEGLALTAEEDLLFVTDRKDNYVAVLRTKDLSLQKKIPTANGPIRVALFDNGRSLIVANSVSGNVQVIDVASLTITRTFNSTLSKFPVPVPINIAVRSDQKTAYITHAFACHVTLIDLIKGEVLNTFQGGYMPDGVAVSKIIGINKDGDNNGVTFSAPPLIINADIDNVWRIVKNVNDYNRISHGAVTAYVDGEIAPGKKIIVRLYEDKFIGKLIPKSSELVTVVDDELKILSWVRKLPGGKFAVRYQFLEKLPDTTTRSTIVLHIPNPIGNLTNFTIGKVVNDALKDLNDGIKAEAERVHAV